VGGSNWGLLVTVDGLYVSKYFLVDSASQSPRTGGGISFGLELNSQYNELQGLRVVVGRGKMKLPTELDGGTLVGLPVAVEVSEGVLV